MSESSASESGPLTENVVPSDTQLRASIEKVLESQEYRNISPEVSDWREEDINTLENETSYLIESQASDGTTGASSGNMNGDIENERDDSFNESTSENDEPTDDEIVEEDYLIAESKPEEKEETESDTEREEEQTVKKKVSSSRSNTKDTSQKKLSDYFKK
jgi:hypothetical protein